MTWGIDVVMHQHQLGPCNCTHSTIYVSPALLMHYDIQADPLCYN